MGWTADQTKAITKDGNIIVSAAAGAGKTSVLTERVLRLVREGAPIDRLLILTFTRAAAGEMRTRIGARLEAEAAATSDAEQKAYLSEQAKRIDLASISTIHSFCSKVVSRHFFRVDLPPSLKTMDETESSVLKRTVLDRVLLEVATEDAPLYRKLMESFLNELTVRELVMTLERFLNAQPSPKQWLKDAKARFDDPDEFRAFLDLQFAHDKRTLSLLLEELRAVRDALPLAYVKPISVLDDLLTRSRAALLADTRPDYADILGNLPANQLRAPKDCSKDDPDFLAARECKSELMAFAKEQAALYSVPDETLRATQEEGATVLDALLLLCDRYRTAYAAEKREKNRIDFDDLEHLTIRILEDDEIAAEYRERYLSIIVDEYQDSNRVQEAILSRIARPNALFYVGDVKQSIYRFRTAEPQLFLEKCDSFHGERGTKIDLNANFRSGQAVIDAVNRVFSVMMKKEIAAIEYDDDAKLKKGSDAPDGRVEFHLFERKQAEGEESISDAEAEARFAAETILKRMEQDVLFDAKKQKQRPLLYSDFAVLLRNKTHAKVWASTLSSYGIPCYAQLSGGYFESVEIRLLLSLLSVLDNRRQDIPLLAVMRSPLFGFTDEELVSLRLNDKKSCWLDLLLQSENEKACACVQTLSRWQALALRLPMAELIYTILDETLLLERMGATAGGGQRVRNIHALLEQAMQFDETGGGLSAFLRHISDVKKTENVGGAQSVTANVVRIMTVHKSKGLEFPIVFFGGLGQKYNFEDETKALLLHGTLGIGLRYHNGIGIRKDTYSRRLLKDTLHIEAWQEELRVLYVGMTRARTDLYLLGSMSGAKTTWETLPLPTPKRLRSTNTSAKLLLYALNGYIPVQIRDKQESPKESVASYRPAIPSADPTEMEKLLHRFSYRYPHRAAVGIPDKTSVTAQTDPSFDFSPPSFLEEQDARVLGTRTHTLLERLPLTDCTEEAFLALCERVGNVPHSHQEAVLSFTKRPLFQRMRKSSRLKREWSFVYPMPANRLFDTEETATVLLQGIMDVCFWEEDGWVLVDYKTDRVEGDPREHAERHRKQLMLYRDVLEAITKQPVKEAYVVLLLAKADVRLIG